MTIRNLSLTFIALLLASILLLQWWTITRFSEDIAKQVGSSAFEVSRATAEAMLFEAPQTQIHTIAVGISGEQAIIKNSSQLKQLLGRAKQDVIMEMIDEQNDDFIQLTADGVAFPIPVPRTGIDKALADFSTKVLYSSLFLLLLGLALAFIAVAKITAPLRQLQQASAKIGQGDLGHQIAATNRWSQRWASQEVATTLNSFNQMSRQIAKLQKQNEILQNQAHLSELADITKGLAHALRNPLNTLNLAIDEINDEQVAERNLELKQIAKHQVKRIDHWVRSLMKMLDDGQSPSQDLDINKVLTELVDNFRLSSAADIQLDLHLDSQVQPIKGITSELTAVLESLFGNAIEAASDDKRVNISSQNSSQGIQLIIEDWGGGFSSQVLAKLFTPHNTNKTYGAGMGLFLAHRVITNLYQGELKVENKLDGGAKISLLINHRQLQNLDKKFQ